MRPRSNDVGSALCNSIGEVGRRTSAPVGAVRPQPNNSEVEGTAREAAGSGRIDGAAIDDRPKRPSEEQSPVGKHEILGFGALALFKEERIAQNRDGKRNN